MKKSVLRELYYYPYYKMTEQP